MINAICEISKVCLFAVNILTLTLLICQKHVTTRHHASVPVCCLYHADLRRNTATVVFSSGRSYCSVRSLCLRRNMAIAAFSNGSSLKHSMLYHAYDRI